MPRLWAGLAEKNGRNRNLEGEKYEVVSKGKRKREWEKIGYVRSREKKIVYRRGCGKKNHKPSAL